MTDSDEGESDDDYVDLDDREGLDEEGSSVRIVKDDDVLERSSQRLEDARKQAKDVVENVRDDVEDRVEDEVEEARESIGERLEESVDQLDSGLIDLLAGFLDTETRAKVYLYLRQRGEATSEEIAEDTGLYPSTVRETLSDLYGEGIVERRKKETSGAGNNPYVYTAVPPSELAKRFSERVEEQLNQLFNLDRYLGGGERRREIASDWSPYKIIVDSDDDER